jgi:hypothetical protein
MPLRVHLLAAEQLPVQQRPADPLAAVVGPHPALEVDRERPAEGARRHRRRERDEQSGPVGHRNAVPAEVHVPAGPPLGEVFRVGVLAGVVELLGGGEQRGDGSDVVGGERAGGETLGQGGEVGHGRRG